MTKTTERKKKGLLYKLKEKWGVNSLWQVFVILLVFSLTGMTVVFLRKTFFHWFGFDENTPFWIKTITYLLLVFPSYQILILVYGTLLGQFSFFWEKEKKMIRFFGKLLSRKEK